VASEAQLASWLKRDNAQISVNSPELFPVLCGLVGLGRLLAEGQTEALPTLRRYAADPRWRLREGVAMALQRWGDQDMAALLAAMERWSRRSRLEQRAAAAGLCEPRLLACPEEARRVLDILDRITTSVVTAPDHKTEEFKILRQALGYCWSVAVVALPAAGRPTMERWLDTPDADVAWIMRENLKKNRLLRLDPEWVEHCAAALQSRS